ncbi:hypothetical protein THAOC_36392 [Thalassiosira oceanica]|uniref:Sulfotransferase domain-containing protein n=1 Tax=Thalassiosira oceanica TaxID=159749 RepID=K0REM7_THAOC|nr:hypothetical protein THAOC_36392 [Thalassiosira oceanica]|eukprot:EJK45022.1 hypothetical protein THAOC_36392 [Thalassiosira oceanica]
MLRGRFSREDGHMCDDCADVPSKHILQTGTDALMRRRALTRIVTFIILCVLIVCSSSDQSIAFRPHRSTEEVPKSSSNETNTSNRTYIEFAEVRQARVTRVLAQEPDKLNVTGFRKLPAKVYARQKTPSKKVIHHPLPNVLLLGAQKAGSTAISDWLLANESVCGPVKLPGEPQYYTKEVHFFDKGDRYGQGINFYSKRFRHCTAGSREEKTDFLLDATPNYLAYPERVKDIYSKAGRDAASELRLVVTLREPASRERSLYNHMVHELSRSGDLTAWYGEVARQDNGTAMAFSQYIESVLIPRFAADSVTPEQRTGMYFDHLARWASLFPRENILVLSYDELQEDPDTFRRRIEGFLGSRFGGRFRRLNEKDVGGKDEPVSRSALDALAQVFAGKNEELYRFLESGGGPEVEQRPFPRFDVGATRT